jgi:hypothetical protein
VSKAISTMTPEQEAAWVAAAQSGRLMEQVGFVMKQDRVARSCAWCGNAFHAYGGTLCCSGTCARKFDWRERAAKVTSS